MLRIDLNADVGEECGDDATLLRIVTTANVAAGGHAGGGQVLEQTVRRAAECGVAVGAHPSYPDRRDFGRVSLADRIDADILRASLLGQVEDVGRACARHGLDVVHVKAHGALYNDAMVRQDMAELIVDVARTTQAPAVVGLPGSVLAQACADRGVAFIPEAYADRAYESDGTLTPRSRPGAVIEDADAVTARVLQIVTDRTAIARDGSLIALDVETVCLHGDTPGAAALALAVRSLLEQRGVIVQAVGRT